MENPPLRRQPVLLPLLFEMDQSPLPLAEMQVLQPGNRQQFVFLKHARSAQPPIGS